MDGGEEYTAEMLESFKNDVRLWIEMDNTLRALKANLRDRTKEKNFMTARILDFMQRHNIDDLNTPIGRLRFQVRRVKSPLSQQEVLRRISEYYQNDCVALHQLRSAVFGTRDAKDKACIRRLPWKPSGV